MADIQLTADEKRNLERLPISIPDYNPGDPSTRKTHPFSRGETVRKYTLDEVRAKAANYSFRTHWFRRELVNIYKQIERPVPYAFCTEDGKIRSLDIACVGFLHMRKPSELRLIGDHKDYLVAVEPTAALLEVVGRLPSTADRGNLGSVVLDQVERNQVEAGSEALFPADDVEPLELELEIEAPVDERLKKLSLKVAREGARPFREAQIRQWSGACVVTGCRVRDALEAAHIYTYLGPQTNHVTNGLLLRADLHRLFDRHRLSIRYDGGELKIVVSKRLAGTEYAAFEGRTIALRESGARPDRRLVAHHFAAFEAKETRFANRDAGENE